MFIPESFNSLTKMMSATIRTEQNNSRSGQDSLQSSLMSNHEISYPSFKKCLTNSALSDKSNRNFESDTDLEEENSAFSSDAEVFSSDAAPISSDQAEFEACKEYLHDIIVAEKSNGNKDWPSVPNVQELNNLTEEKYQELKNIIASGELEYG